jgi:hypothetical protein
MLCQVADEDLLIAVGAIVFPGFVHRVQGTNGLRLKLDGNYLDLSLETVAADRFQELLGIVRAWNPLAGQRSDEVRPGLGPGSIRDEAGNQVLRPVSAILYTESGNVVAYAREAKEALQHSQTLRTALWLHGRRDRNAADFYMIWEYAEQDFGGRKGVALALGVTDNDIARLKSSTNNLVSTEGGRHAGATGVPAWTLNQQRDFVSGFLKRWISYRAQHV